LNVTYRLLVYADDVNISGINIKRKHRSSVRGSRYVRAEIDTEETKYVVVSRHQNAGHNYNLLIANK